jgi:hypothetical protein
MVLWVGVTKLKVDNNPLVAISHNTVGAMLVNLAILNRENGTLVE